MENVNFDELVTKRRKKRKKRIKINFFALFFVVFSILLSISISAILSNVLALNTNIFFVGNRVNTPQQKFYCATYGEYNTEKDALVDVNFVQRNGGAGVINFYENKFTILVSSYLTEKDLQNVLEKNKDNAMQLNTMIVEIKEKSFDCNATSFDKNSLNKICNLYLFSYKEISNMALKLDTLECDKTQTLNKLFSLSETIRQDIIKFENCALLLDKNSYSKLESYSNKINSLINNVIINQNMALNVELKKLALEIVLVAQAL